VTRASHAPPARQRGAHHRHDGPGKPYPQDRPGRMARRNAQGASHGRQRAAHAWPRRFSKFFAKRM